MALYTIKGHHAGLWEMLEEMPFDKITVTALVKRCDISSNTFYYHYRDIYDLLDAWFHLELGRFTGEGTDWHTSTKGRHAGVSGPSRQDLPCVQRPVTGPDGAVCVLPDGRHLFRLVQQRTENSGLPQERVEEIAAFCRYAYVGFFLQFLWNRMEADIDRSVDRLGS